MTPVLYVKVVVDPVVGKSTLNIYKIELVGSRIAEIANGTFDGAAMDAERGGVIMYIYNIYVYVYVYTYGSFDGTMKL